MEFTSHSLEAASLRSRIDSDENAPLGHRLEFLIVSFLGKKREKALKEKRKAIEFSSS